MVIETGCATIVGGRSIDEGRGGVSVPDFHAKAITSVCLADNVVRAAGREQRLYGSRSQNNIWFITLVSMKSEVSKEASRVLLVEVTVAVTVESTPVVTTVDVEDVTVLVTSHGQIVSV